MNAFIGNTGCRHACSRIRTLIRRATEVMGSLCRSLLRRGPSGLKLACATMVVSASVAHAQTNVYPTLTVGDRTYTNVTIGRVTAADAVLLFSGGGARVALSNLPPELQRELGYDPTRAEQLLATRARQRAAVRERNASVAAEAAALGPPRTVRVVEIDTSGTTPLCVTDIGEIWIESLPRITITRLDELQRLESQIQRLSTQLFENVRALRAEEATTPEIPGAPEWFMEEIRAQRVREIQLRNLVTTQDNALAQLTQTHQHLLEEAHRATLIVAAKTSRKYRGHEVWKFLGMAPPPKVETETISEAAPPTAEPGETNATQN